MLAPTKPLSEQHYNSLARLLNIDKDHILLLTGSIATAKRQELEPNAKVIIATPQTFANDLKRGRLSLEDFGVVIFDECHRAVGRYAYTYIADECKIAGYADDRAYRIAGKRQEEDKRADRDAWHREHRDKDKHGP